MNLEFANLGIGKYALLALIPLIILYLIRPKPRDKVIPSLMFFIRATGKGKAAALLRKIISDPLFLLQLLLILMVAAAAAEPFLQHSKDWGSENTVLVLDVSASMKTSHRFRDMMNHAEDHLEGRVSIILVKHRPEILLSSGTESEASTMLNQVSVTGCQSNIGDALLLAEQQLKGKQGSIVVISDFIDTTGANLKDLKSIIEKRGKRVRFIDVGREATNMGITDIDYQRELIKVYLKNFNQERKTATLDLGREREQVEIMPNSIEVIPVVASPGLNQITLKPKDDFSTDNRLYLNLPQEEKIKVLLITNQKRSFLRDFLEAYKPVELEINQPPLIPSIEHDIVIVHQVNPQDFLLSTVNKLEEYTNEGGDLIITAQKGLTQLNLENLLPVTITGVGNNTLPKAKLETKLTRDLSFSQVNYFFTTMKNQTGVTDIVVGSQGDSLVSMGSKKQGKVVYYGIIEEESDFKLSPSYPLFWQRLLNTLVGTTGFEQLNRRTGSTLVVGEGEQARSPSGRAITSNRVLEETGFYQLGNRTIAVNLLNQNESNVNKNQSYSQLSLKWETGGTPQAKLHLLPYLLAAALVVAVLEIFIIKFRGDL